MSQMGDHFHDDECHSAPQRAPWLRGSDLYEAYGRFLERMESGKIREDDGGWCLYGSIPGIGYIRTDGAGYDREFGYSSEAEADAHNSRERAKERRIRTNKASGRSLKARAKNKRRAA